MCLGMFMLSGEKGRERIGGSCGERSEEGDVFVGRRRKGFDSRGVRGIGGEDRRASNLERR